ncbi:MAG: hypothetical protein R3E86_13560 [Pseudomonadales bacterium]
MFAFTESMAQGALDFYYKLRGFDFDRNPGWHAGYVPVPPVLVARERLWQVLWLHAARPAWGAPSCGGIGRGSASARIESAVKSRLVRHDDPVTP